MHALEPIVLTGIGLTLHGEIILQPKAMMYILLALFAYTLAAHITSEAWCAGEGVCDGDPSFRATFVQLGECYLNCNPCSTSSCVSEMYASDQGSNLIFQYIFGTAEPEGTPNCDDEPIAEANFTCDTCTDPATRGLNVEDISVRYSCRIASADEIIDAIETEALRNAINNAFIGFDPAVTTEIVFNDPSQSAGVVVWVIRITFASILTDQQKTDAEALLQATVAGEIGTPQANVNVELFLVSSDKRAVQDAIYDAVITINGAGALIVSAILSLFVFLALFI